MSESIILQEVYCVLSLAVLTLAGGSMDASVTS